ncbi:MAG: hypothetical protein J6L02_07280 [Bacteroidales bacterium]|nr:hypothetical protein [Bacteroidales bacterium]
MRRLILILSIFTSLSLFAKEGKFIYGPDGNAIYIKGEEIYPMAAKVKIVESFPDYKIQFVESFPDIKVQFVNSFPGVPHPSNK